MEPVFPADVKTRCFHFLPQQLRIWSFLLSSVSWQSRFLQFFLKAGLSPVTYKSFKSIVIVSFCFSNNLPNSGLQQHVFISLHFCSLHVQQGSPWAWIKASAGLHHFCGSGGESISCLFNLLDKKKRKLVPQSCLTLCDPMDCILPCPSVHGILKLLETAYIPWFTASFIHYQTSNATGLQILSRATFLSLGRAKKCIPCLRIVGLRMCSDWAHIVHTIF